MSPTDLREQRLALGYSPSLLAEILRVDRRKLLDWESGTTPIEDPDSIGLAINALRAAHTNAWLYASVGSGQ
jgi:DNA-binding transcriptional regulator YiaG